jgi:hypothetical protein
MKNLVFLTTIFFSAYSFAQGEQGEKKPKLEIRTSNAVHEIHRKTNEHKLERIDLKRDDKRENTHKPTLERHQRPHLDRKNGERPSKQDLKKDRYNEIRQEKRQEKREEILQKRKERRDNK